MSKTTGVEDGALALPKGGGAVRGLGATFETDLNTGTGSYSVPIETPAGPNGIKPQIQLRYHSAAGNGPWGIGWTMGGMAIARRTEGRIPTYGRDDDAFVLLGVEDLVPLGGGIFRLRVDTMRARIRQVADGWELTDTRGTVHRLGQSAGARIETVANDLTKTAVWLLEEMRDTNGNSVHYRYRADGAQRYLKQVEWGTYRLDFQYESREDPLTSGRYGFLIDTRLRCSGIELHVTTLAPSLARSWTFNYVASEGAGLSLLHQVTLRGHASDGTSLAVPPLTLDYTAMGTRALERVESAADTEPGEFAAGRLELLDWDGDGLPDLLELGPARARVWPNLGRGRWGYPRNLPQVPTPLSLDEPGIAFADMEGNGTADLIVLDRPLASFYPHRPGGGFDVPVYWRQTPCTSLSSNTARLVDLNGDGVADLLVTGDQFLSIYLRDGGDGWQSRPMTIPRPQAPPVFFTDPHVHVADMNGDGLQDVVTVLGGAIRYWPYLGNGRWAAPVDVQGTLDLPREFDPRRLQLADIDGDGCADVLYVDVNRILYWLNRGGVSLGARHEIAYTPPARMDQVRLVDLKGSGTLGVLWSGVTNGVRRDGHRYLDLAGGQKPYLLTRIDNGLGMRIAVRYRSSTEFALDDAAAGRPWSTFHPFPLQCVAEIEQRDLITGQSTLTRHRYHDGRYDGDARAFLGFGRVEVDAVGDDAIPTLRTHNVYHLGLDPADPQRHLTPDERLRLGALRRKLLRTETYGLDGGAEQDRPYHVVHHEYTVRVEPAVGGALVLVPFETRTFEEQRERAAAPFAFREISYLELDAHGNFTRQRLRAWMAGEELDRDQDVTTEISFAIDLPSHIVSLPARITQRDRDGNVLSVAVTHYDGPAHEGLAEGQVTAGNVTRQDTLALSDADAVAVYGAAQPDWPALGYHRRPGEDGWWITQASYERNDAPAGLVLTVRGPRGHGSRLAYDASRQYPATLTDAVGNVLEGTVDERAFQMATLRDANSRETRDVFDALGRVVAIVKPGDSDILPSTTFEYRTDELPIRQITRHRIEHGVAATQDDVQFFSGRGELLQQFVQGEGDQGRNWIAQETREYTVRGQVKRRVTPFYTAVADLAPGPAATAALAMRFDTLGRLTEQWRANGTSLVQRYGPGRIEAVDEAGRLLVHRTDALQRVRAVERPLPDRTVSQRYHYNELNRLVHVEHPAGGETRMTYDLLGRVLVEETSDTGRVVFVVDAAGNQVQRTTRAGRTVRTTFDALDRIVETREGGVADAELVYAYLDAGEPVPVDGERNRRGRPHQIRDRIGTVTLSYDDLGRVVETRRGVDALARDLVTTITYDALGRHTRIVLPEPTPGAGRRLVDYRYNARGLPDASPGHVKTAEYDVQGHLVRLVYQNDVETRLEHDPSSGRPHRLRVIGPGNADLRDHVYTFDPVGNLLEIISTLAVEAGSFVFDHLNRLTGATYGSGEQFTYAYDDNGNVTDVVGLGALTYGGPIGSGAVTQAGPDTYAYDLDGHLAASPTGTFAFDGFDNLRRVDLTDGRTMRCVYDYQGQRAVRTLSDGSSSLFADPNLELHNGQSLLWVSFGGRRILALTAGGGVFVHGDLLGTPTLYTAPDGSVVRRLAFGPYGTLRFDSSASGGPPNGLRYGGQPIDDATGLYCLGRRFYDPRLGRFISADRAVPGVYRLDAWNRYTYGFDNPVRYSDPTGRLSGWDVLAIVAIVVVVAVLVIAGIFTFGATWAVAGVVINVGALLIGTAVGVAAGAVLGGIAAWQAGGDVWKGVLFGGFVGGTAAFAGGFLGAVAGGLANSLISSIYAKLIVAGAVQGAIAGAGTGAAVGFAGGKGNAESIWQHIWKGAVIGAVTGALLGLVSAYISQHPLLQLGIPDKLNSGTAAAGGAADKLSYLDTSASLGQGVARGATGAGGLFGLGSFVGFGSSPATYALNVSLGCLPNVVMNYGIITVATGTFVGLDKYNILEFSDVVVGVLEVAPYFIGVVLTFLDDANLGFFEDMKTGLHSGFDMPQPA